MGRVPKISQSGSVGRGRGGKRGGSVARLIKKPSQAQNKRKSAVGVQKRTGNLANACVPSDQPATLALVDGCEDSSSSSTGSGMSDADKESLLSIQKRLAAGITPMVAEPQLNSQPKSRTEDVCRIVAGTDDASSSSLSQDAVSEEGSPIENPTEFRHGETVEVMPPGKSEYQLAHITLAFSFIPDKFNVKLSDGSDLFFIGSSCIRRVASADRNSMAKPQNEEAKMVDLPKTELATSNGRAGQLLKSLLSSESKADRLSSALSLRVEKHPEWRNECFRHLRECAKDGKPVASGAFTDTITPEEAESIIKSLGTHASVDSAKDSDVGVHQPTHCSKGSPLPTPQQQFRTRSDQGITGTDRKGPIRGILRKRSLILSRNRRKKKKHVSGLEEPQVRVELVDGFKYLGEDLWFQQPGATAECDNCGHTSRIPEGKLCGGRIGFSFTRNRFLCSTCDVKAVKRISV